MTILELNHVGFRYRPDRPVGMNIHHICLPLL